MKFEQNCVYIVEWGNSKIQSGRTRVRVVETTTESAKILFDNGHYEWISRESGVDYTILESLGETGATRILLKD